jgi:formate hydrogenlyase subunit 4
LYPPAILIVILLLTGEHPRRLVFAYLAGAALIVLSVGVGFLFVLSGSGATQQDSTTASAGVDVVLGAALLALGIWAWRRRHRAPTATEEGDDQGGRISEWSGRATASAKWAFALGILMYLPSPLYLGAIKAVADSGDSTASRLLAILICAVCVMLFVEIPAVALLLRPDGLEARLKRFQAWLARNGWTILAVLAIAAGVYLLVRGIAELT